MKKIQESDIYKAVSKSLTSVKKSSEITASKLSLTIKKKIKRFHLVIMAFPEIDDEILIVNLDFQTMTILNIWGHQNEYKEDTDEKDDDVHPSTSKDNTQAARKQSEVGEKLSEESKSSEEAQMELQQIINEHAEKSTSEETDPEVGVKSGKKSSDGSKVKKSKVNVEEKDTHEVEGTESQSSR